MEEIKLLLFKDNSKNTCFMCFKEDKKIINIDDRIEIYDEISNTTTSLRDISNWLFSYYDIITHQACEKCTKLMVEIYTTINRGLKKLKIIQEVIEKVTNALNSKSDLNGNKMTIDIKEDMATERLENDRRIKQENMKSQLKVREAINITRKCNKCAYKTNNKQNFESHINKHLNVRPYICKLCEKGFFSLKNLREHSLTHEQSYIMMCDICGERFSYRKTLNMHMRSHVKYKPYNCESCGHKFVSMSQMNEHIKRKHGPKPFDCNFCDKKYSLQKDLRRHIKSVHELENFG